MTLKNLLPSKGSNFSSKVNLSGHHSLAHKLTLASHQGGTLHGLDSKAIEAITDHLDNSYVRKEIKYGKGISDYHVKDIKRKLYSEVKNSYQRKKLNQVVDFYSEAHQEKPSESSLAVAHPPAVKQVAPKINLVRPAVENIAPRHQVSASPLNRQSNLPSVGIGSMPPRKPPMPPSVKLVV